MEAMVRRLVGLWLCCHCLYFAVAMVRCTVATHCGYCQGVIARCVLALIKVMVNCAVGVYFCNRQVHCWIMSVQSLLAFIVVGQVCC